MKKYDFSGSICRLSLVGLFAASASTVAANAQVETAPATDNSARMKTVTVTGRKRTESIQDVPFAVRRRKVEGRIERIGFTVSPGALLLAAAVFVNENARPAAEEKHQLFWRLQLTAVESHNESVHAIERDNIDPQRPRTQKWILYRIPASAGNVGKFDSRRVVQPAALSFAQHGKQGIARFAAGCM